MGRVEVSYQSYEACRACGLEGEGMVCFHHVLTRKSNPEFAEVKWNMIDVCLIHHNEFHAKGNSHMINRYKGVKRWFEENGWYLDLGKWMHDRNEKSHESFLS